MSKWTHVAGCIRVDGIPSITPTDLPVRVLGPMSTYQHRVEHCTLPCGSEGSLKYHVIYAEPDDADMFTITIWGDLRDYSFVGSIVHWWRETLDSLGLIRSAILLIEVEGQDPVILRYEAKDDEAD